MQQVMTSYRSGRQQNNDTDAHRFSALPCRLLIIKAPLVNTGTVTILGAPQATVLDADTNGIVLNPGDPPLALWVDNMNRLAYKFSVANETVQWIAGM